jgi:hypothetical protein
MDFQLDTTRPGDFVVAIRATDRSGQLQTAENRGTVHDGATGIQRVSAKVEG